MNSESSQSTLSRRCRVPEIMDDPALDAQQHIQALQGLERINRWSFSLRILWPPIRDLARAVYPRSLRVLDIATGAGDLPIALWHRARRSQLPMQVDGCDQSPRAVAHAQARAKQAQAAVNFFKLDIFTDEIPPDYDVILTSLFLHHIDNAQVVSLLRRMAASARSLVLVNDLARSARGLALAFVGTRLLSTSKVVHVDGPRSVRAAHTINEVHQLAKEAGLSGAVITPRWPCRFLLSWKQL